MCEVKYRGQLIGWLVEGADGFLRYEKAGPYLGMEGSILEWAPMP